MRRSRPHPPRLLALVIVLVAAVALACTATAPDGPETAGQSVQIGAAAVVTPTPRPALVGPRAIYLALGDSLAYGVQPNFVLNEGYTEVLFARFREQGTEQVINLACPGETTTTMIGGGCQLRSLRKVRYEGSQLDTALALIADNRGRVSPVTLTLGVNDVIDDIGPGCRERHEAFVSHLEAMGANLDLVIGKLTEALDGQGDLIVTLYYNPFESACPNTATYIKQINGLIAEVAHRHGAHVADTTAVFAGRVCELTWFCTRRDTHANTAGYRAIADAILGLLK